MSKIKFLKTRDVTLPSRAHSTDAGIDFYIPRDIDVNEMNELQLKNNCNAIILSADDGSKNVSAIKLEPGCSAIVPVGVKTKFDDGQALIFFNKSGVATKKKICLLACVVDSSYQGEIFVSVVNNGTNTEYLFPNDKICQGILMPVNLCDVEESNTIDDLYSEEGTERGAGGFGSTGN